MPAEVGARVSRGGRLIPFWARMTTAVDQYWTRHTVRAERFRSRRASERNLEWRFEQYPLFREFSGLWGEHDGEVILDYGCGPGNDLVGYALYTGARRIVGVDVSPRALELARDRLALHGIDPERVELLQGSDASVAIPLDDASVDFVQSQGVLHHTSDPEAILRELHRVLRPGGRGLIMVYNRASLWFHLYTAYEKMIVEDAFPGLDVHEAFRRNTDGPECPISRSYPPAEWVAPLRGRRLRGRVRRRLPVQQRTACARAVLGAGDRGPPAGRRAPRLPALPDVRLRGATDVPRRPRRHRRHVPPAQALTANRVRTILVVYGLMQHPLRSTVEDHLYSFRRYSQARVFYANALVGPVPGMDAPDPLRRDRLPHELPVVAALGPTGGRDAARAGARAGRRLRHPRGDAAGRVPALGSAVRLHPRRSRRRRVLGLAGFRVAEDLRGRRPRARALRDRRSPATSTSGRSRGSTRSCARRPSGRPTSSTGRAPSGPTSAGTGCSRPASPPRARPRRGRAA